MLEFFGPLFDINKMVVYQINTMMIFDHLCTTPSSKPSFFPVHFDLDIVPSYRQGRLNSIHLHIILLLIIDS